MLSRSGLRLMRQFAATNQCLLCHAWTLGSHTPQHETGEKEVVGSNSANSVRLALRALPDRVLSNRHEMQLPDTCQICSRACQLLPSTSAVVRRTDTAFHTKRLDPVCHSPPDKVRIRHTPLMPLRASQIDCLTAASQVGCLTTSCLTAASVRH
jgi:hypothetical protein